MPRPHRAFFRIEKENGVYHIINRGNCRQDLFIKDGSHQSFQSCLFEACIKCGWVLEGFCVMTKWLRSTFANGYHTFGKVHGKLFPGRYQGLIVEEDAVPGGRDRKGVPVGFGLRRWKREHPNRKA